jgi:hypothetical protein
MSYAVIHVQKFKMNDVKGIQIHNQRESPNSKNKDIDREKTELNYDLRNPKLVNYNHKVKEIIKVGYTIDKAIRKDAVVMTGTLVTSDKEFFSKLSQAEQKKFFQDAYDYLKERYGEKNIVAAVVHLDEKTPHMHVISVPITEDGRLSAKTLFDRKALRELQNELPKLLQDNGFDVKRGEPGSDKTHVSPANFKKQEIHDLENEIKGLCDKAIARQNDLEILQGGLDRLDVLKFSLDRVDQIEGQAGLLNRGKVSIPKEDFEALKDMAKKHLASGYKIEKFTKDYSSLKNDFDKVYHTKKSTQSDNLELRRKLGEVESKLKNINKFLEATDQVSTAIEFAHKIKQIRRIKRSTKMSYR